MIIKKTKDGKYLVVVEGGIIRNANTEEFIHPVEFVVDYQPQLIDEEEVVNEWTYGTLVETSRKYKAGDGVEFVVLLTDFTPEPGNTHVEYHETVVFTKGGDLVI